jgi:primosomal protein N' (replication factor Y)
MFSHSNGLKVKDEMDLYVQLFKENKDIEVVGFGQSPIFKMSNKYRYEILLRSSNIKALLQALHSVQTSNATIDMDTIY